MCVNRKREKIKRGDFGISNYNKMAWYKKIWYKTQFHFFENPFLRRAVCLFPKVSHKYSRTVEENNKRACLKTRNANKRHARIKHARI